jgi:hypothetical protein
VNARFFRHLGRIHPGFGARQPCRLNKSAILHGKLL